MKNAQEQKKGRGGHKAGKTHRAHELVETLKRLGGSARTAHLADVMNVSEETIRRTVKKLSREGIVSRVHGGVYLAEEHKSSTFHQRIAERPEAKRRIATALAELVEDESCLFLDVGSTTVFVAEALRQRKKLTIVTNSMPIAQILMNHNANRVFLAGGELKNDIGGTFGTPTQKFVSRFRADLAVLSAEAVDANQGFLLRDQDEADLARTFVSHARKTIMAADISKVGQSAPIISCEPGDVDLFITDAELSGELSRAMKNWDIKVLVAPAKRKKNK